MQPLGKSRMEAFSDGVVAIIVTIMVLELKVPHDASPEALLHLAPIFLSYALSFLVVAILWVNHHHLLHTATRITGRELWLNNHFLFWLSLVPFTTAYIGENHLAPLPVALYGLALCLAGCAFDLLRREIARDQAGDPAMAALHRRSSRTNAVSALLYLAAVPLAWVSVWLSVFIYVLVPAIYFMPRNIEKMAAGKQPA
ncbi:TMEM175 family protein [Ramlibacter sp. MMS24-I3-19]|uniref:TMEM175 family protein n=1 Tax=Ramlibacter sp. MMS24-I3-19 TaxID=3416606 RepID=UPI003D06B343